MELISVHVWSDVACPWCYVGKRRLESAIARMPRPGMVRVVWRSFELDPDAPRMGPVMPYPERLAKKYGTSLAQGEAAVARMTAIAAVEGLAFHFDRVRPGNTLDAHRLLHFARDCGVQEAVQERFFRAYLTEGEPIGDTAVLTRLSAEAGLDPERARQMLRSDAYAEEVRADEREARALGVKGVPFFAIEGTPGVSGAQPADVLHGALLKAWKQRLMPAISADATCVDPMGSHGRPARSAARRT